ncbi:FKBP-type peptidyl-prolyl cis-trans isomerase [Crocinitomix catalasitica]|uniref:FKBP-type peptidyl-prolyl cis-trans isomerase n=1 Tax=Crocinitomix catalasitica TaxID=184607 RepID=UPI00068558CC|nr:FKBP-type peptidyl-prolyl cis-trans isomerase [Crocinitomix catalasitica]
MKNLFYTIGLITFLVACNGNPDQETTTNETVDAPLDSLKFENYNDQISYSIGLDHGAGCATVYSGEQTKGKFVIAEVAAGVTDYLADNPLRIKASTIDSLLGLYLAPQGQVDSSKVSINDASYAIGLGEAQFLVNSLVARGIDQNIEIDKLVEGINDGIAGKNRGLSLEDARNMVYAYYIELNKSLGDKFLSENKLKDSVITTASGLQYQVIKEGNGKRPNLTDSCVVHYTGRFIDGRVFESTVESQRPAQFTPMGVILGWQEGLQLMKEGGKTRFFIPFNLAYGENGSGKIEPYSTLVFDIELIKVIRFK